MATIAARGPQLLCPVHSLPLLKSEKHGIEIDYCPQCHGAWFERGELDKVIDVYANLRSEAQAGYEAERGDRSDRDRSRRLKKLEDFLEDLFDFD